MRKKTGSKKTRTLNFDERKNVAENIKAGLMVKQAAAKWQITEAYAYSIFYEFLEWKAEWRIKE